MKIPHIEVDLQLYTEALNLSIHDDEWLAAAFAEKQNIKNIIKNIVKENVLVATNEYVAKNDLSKIFKYKKVRNLDETTLMYLFDSNSEETKRNLLQLIYNQTKRNAEVVKNLISEYCDQTRDIFDAKVIPCPDTIKETTIPITNFKISVTEDKFFTVEIGENELLLEDELDNFLPIQEYFMERKKKKRITRGYLTKKDITKEQVKNLLSKLNYLKEVEVPVNFALKDGDYKIVYREHQVAHFPDKDITINDKNLKILHIEEKE